MTKFTSRRNLSGTHQILRDGQPVGEAWRYPPRQQGSRRRSAQGAFGMRLDGFLWVDGRPVRHGTAAGFSTVSVPRMRDAIALAEATLTKQR